MEITGSFATTAQCSCCFMTHCCIAEPAADCMHLEESCKHGITYAANSSLGSDETGGWLCPQVYNVSGLLPMQQQLRAMGPEYSNAASWTSYQLCPRASIFRRNFSDVVDAESMKHLMRSNDFATDKVSCLSESRQVFCHRARLLWRAGHCRRQELHMNCHKASQGLVGAVQLSWGSPVAAVCARGDLESADAAASGCFDTKVTSHDMALRMQVEVVTGPTTEVCTEQAPSLPSSCAIACLPALTADARVHGSPQHSRP